MPIEEQIARLRAALATINAAIVQTEAALMTANAADKPSLNAALVDLRAERTRLQLQLDSLEAAAVVVPPLAAAAAAPPSAAKESARESRRAKATLKFVKEARSLARMLVIGDDKQKPVPRKKKKRSPTSLPT